MTTALDNYINSSIKRREFDCYTDGSCNNLSENREGGAAYLVLENGVEVERRSKALPHTTNNRAEMIAIISAVNFCPIASKITIHTDSKYAIYAFETLKRRLTSDVKNSDLIQKYRELAALRDVSFVWVKGHNGDKYNEIVDEMANREYNNLKESLKV